MISLIVSGNELSRQSLDSEFSKKVKEIKQKEEIGIREIELNYDKQIKFLENQIEHSTANNP